MTRGDRRRYHHHHHHHYHPIYIETYAKGTVDLRKKERIERKNGKERKKDERQNHSLIV